MVRGGGVGGVKINNGLVVTVSSTARPHEIEFTENSIFLFRVGEMGRCDKNLFEMQLTENLGLKCCNNTDSFNTSFPSSITLP